MDERLPISVLLLARDETRELEALIPELLAFAREVVVVWDTAGDPATRDAARRLGASVHERALDGFGAQRRFALERCTQDWVLWIDADERLAGTGDPAAALARRLTAASGDGFRLARVSSFLGRRIRFCGWQREQVLRVFRRAAARFDDAPVHEQVHVGALDATPSELWLDHRSYATWEGCTGKLVRYADANAEKAWRAGRRAGPLDVLARPPLRFLRQYVFQLGFLDGAHGLVLCALSAAQVFLKYAGLWSRSRGVGRP